MDKHPEIALFQGASVATQNQLAPRAPYLKEFQFTQILHADVQFLAKTVLVKDYSMLVFFKQEG